jgi:hypothetical protein
LDSKQIGLNSRHFLRKKGKMQSSLRHFIAE